MARRRRAQSASPPTNVVLDAEALSVLAAPGERGVSRRRASAILAVAMARGSRVIVPAPVLAEVGRSPARRQAVDAVLPRLVVAVTDRQIAQQAGLLLGDAGLGTAHAVDAFVVATAAQHQPAVVVTGDPGDLGALCATLPTVAVEPLS